MHGGSEDQAPSSSGEQPPNDLFVVHKLSKLDTLAGLAIRYNVAVSDIKRSNSLLSDSAMFARDSLLIPKRPLPMGQEYSAWAGMIVTQYGQISRGQDRPARSYSGSGGAGAETPQQSAIAQLRAHYGLSPASSPTAARGYAHSEDGFSSGRPSEVEMQDMGSGGAMPRRPSLPELNSYAGERSEDLASLTPLLNGWRRRRGGTGPPEGDERLRRRRAGEGDEAWCSQGSAASGDSAMHAGHILPPAGGASPDRSRRMAPSRFHSPDRGPHGRPPHGAPARQASAGAAAGPAPGRRRESLLERIKRAASQPALAAPSGPSIGALSDSAIASIRHPPPELGARALLHEAAAALQGPKDAQKKE